MTSDPLEPPAPRQPADPADAPGGAQDSQGENLDGPGDHPVTLAELSDLALIAAVRAGDPDAFGILYTRHVTAAQRLALALARHRSDADDLVAEAFAKLLATLRGRSGPTAAFRPYLLTTVRNLFYDRTRRDQRVSVTDDLARLDAGTPFDDPALAGLERTLVARAFARLPERWQAVLWHTEVEGESPAAVAPMLALSPNGVSALAYRARERLRQNYLREHITSSPTDQCQATVERLGGYVRDGLSTRDRGAVDAHLSECRRCQVLYLELGEINAGIPADLLAPVVLGEAAATAYLGAAATSGVTGLLAPAWGNARRLARRRSVQAGAGGAVVAAVGLALALVLASGSAPVQDPAGPPGLAAPAPPGTDPDASPDPDPDQVDGPGNGPAAPGPGLAGPGEPGQPPSPPLAPVAVDVSLAPVGALVPDRPGVVALTMAARPASGGTGGGTGGPGAGRPLVLPVVAQPGGAATGPLTALITVPDGVALRAGDPGAGWSCVPDRAAIRCTGPSLPAGATTAAYVPVAVAAAADPDGSLRVRVTGPGIEATSATASGGVSADGLAAVFAGIRPATVVTGGNALLSCPGLDLTCAAARTGGAALGRVDNNDYLMTRYADPRAPAGAPKRAAVSSATLRIPGEVVWAGLYWAGSGTAPSSPTAYLRVPGGYGYVAVPAGTVRQVARSALGQAAYQAAADVTSLVTGSAGGQWWVAVDGDAFPAGVGAFGGWALVIVAEDGGPDRTVAVFDELTPLRDHGSYSAPAYGTPGPALVGFVAWEGDRGRAGTQLRLAGDLLGGPDRDNIAASRTDGTPAGWNTLGTDARVVATQIPVGADLPVLAASTGHDAWLLGPVVIVSPSP